MILNDEPPTSTSPIYYGTANDCGATRSSTSGTSKTDQLAKASDDGNPVLIYPGHYPDGGSNGEQEGGQRESYSVKLGIGIRLYLCSLSKTCCSDSNCFIIITENWNQGSSGKATD